MCSDGIEAECDGDDVVAGGLGRCCCLLSFRSLRFLQLYFSMPHRSKWKRYARLLLREVGQHEAFQPSNKNSTTHDAQKLNFLAMSSITSSNFFPSSMYSLVSSALCFSHGRPMLISRDWQRNQNQVGLYRQGVKKGGNVDQQGASKVN
jgi:hypothetical protein